MIKIETYEELVKLAKLIKADSAEIYSDCNDYKEFHFKWNKK